MTVLQGAPFLAMRTLKQLDLRISSESIEETKTLRNELTQLLSLGRFNYSVNDLNDPSDVKCSKPMLGCEDVKSFQISSILVA